MYHWWLLWKSSRAVVNEPCAFAAGGGYYDRFYSRGQLTECPSDTDKRSKFFWLGTIEALPLFAGSAASFLTEYSPLFLYGAGIVLTLSLCWLLRNEVPPTPIHATAGGQPECAGAERGSFARTESNAINPANGC